MSAARGISRSYAPGVHAAGTSSRRRSVRLRAATVPAALAVLGLAACTSGTPGQDPAASSGTGASSATTACRTPVLDEDGAFQAEASGGEVNALVFGPLPPRSGSELKIVWRVTGAGDLAVRAERPDGSAGVLTFGPEAHPASNFDRPGDEWGTGFLFDAPGCWHLDVRREALHARVAVLVVG